MKASDRFENSLWTRRQWLGAAGGCAMTGLTVPAWAQPVSAAAEEAKAPPLPPLGSALEVPRIELIGGGVFDPAAAQGKPLLVYWWASTCPFCAQQSPVMDRFWREHREQGLAMVALSIDRKPEDAAAYLKAKGYTFPAAWASPQWRQRFPKPRGLPITLLRGRDGKLAVAEKGQMFPEDVDELARYL